MSRRERIDATDLLDEPLPQTGWQGPYPGTVVSTADPERRGRIRVRVPQVYGVSGGEAEFIPDERLPWAEAALPAHDYHAAFEPGDGVWVIFWGGGASSPVWLGQFLGDGDAPAEFLSSYSPEPKTRILKTTTGHTIEMRWVEGEERITVKTATGILFQMDEPTTAVGPKITLKITDQKRIEIDGKTQAINIIAPTGQINVTALAGLLNLAGQGVTIASTGTAPTIQTGGGTSAETFTGAVTKNFNGAYALTVVGATTLVMAAVTATIASLTLTAPLVVTGVLALGAAGVKFRLAHERVFILLQDMLWHQVNHSHAALGAAPTQPGTVAQAGSPPRAGGLTSLPAGNISADVTTMVTASLTAN